MDFYSVSKRIWQFWTTYAFTKKSTIFTQSLRNFVKINYPWVPYFEKVSLWLDKNCGFLNKSICCSKLSNSLTHTVDYGWPLTTLPLWIIPFAANSEFNGDIQVTWAPLAIYHRVFALSDFFTSGFSMVFAFLLISFHLIITM